MPLSTEALRRLAEAGLTGLQLVIVSEVFDEERVRPRAPANPNQAAGGHARAAALSPERRSEIASTAAHKRWDGHTNDEHSLEEGTEGSGLAGS